MSHNLVSPHRMHNVMQSRPPWSLPQPHPFSSQSQIQSIWKQNKDKQIKLVIKLKYMYYSVVPTPKMWLFPFKDHLKRLPYLLFPLCKQNSGTESAMPFHLLHTPWGTESRRDVSKNGTPVQMTRDLYPLIFHTEFHELPFLKMGISLNSMISNHERSMFICIHFLFIL